MKRLALSVILSMSAVPTLAQDGIPVLQPRTVTNIGAPKPAAPRPGEFIQAVRPGQTRSVTNINPLPVVNSNPGVSPARRPVRRLASVDGKAASATKVRRRTPRNADSTDIRFGIYGGTSSLSSANGDVQAGREEQKLGSNILLGVVADVRFMQYYGVELDGFYGIAPNQTIDYGNGEVYKKSIQQSGAMFNFKGQYPTRLGSWKVVPKLGLGYGFTNLKQKTEVESPADTVNYNESVKGPYAVVGFDVEPISDLLFSFDYATSVGSSGTAEYSSQASGASTLDLEGAAYSRMRVGLFYRVYNNVLLGGQYTRRSISSSSEDAAVNSLTDISVSESMSQIAAAILFQF